MVCTDTMRCVHADNSIGAEGMVLLAKALATNTTITEIGLGCEWGNACEGAPQGWAHAMQALTERGSTTATLNDVLHGHVAHSQMGGTGGWCLGALRCDWAQPQARLWVS